MVDDIFSILRTKKNLNIRDGGGFISVVDSKLMIVSVSHVSKPGKSLEFALLLFHIQIIVWIANNCQNIWHFLVHAMNIGHMC